MKLSDGTPPLVTLFDSAVVAVVWWEVQAATAPLHRKVGYHRCDTELRTTTAHYSQSGVRTHPARSGGNGFQLTGSCECREVFVDALLIAEEFLSRRNQLENPLGAVRFHVRMRLPDLHRRHRTSRGAQARPKTVNDNRYGRALPDDFHRTVFVQIVDEAGISAPMDGDDHLLRSLANRCATELGGDAADYLARIPAALSTVEHTCRMGARVNVGTRTHPDLVTWWEAYVERPLGRRPRTDIELSVNSGDRSVPAIDIGDRSAYAAFDRLLDSLALADLIPPQCRDESELLLVEVLTEAVRRASHDRQEAALRQAIAVLADRGFIADRPAEALLGDQNQIRAALTCVREIVDDDHGRAPRQGGHSPGTPRTSIEPRTCSNENRPNTKAKVFVHQ